MRHLSLVLFSVLFLLCASAFGQAAKQHFFAGQSYYEQGRYQKAIGEFEEAYRLDPRPLLLYNISQAYERLGDLQDAVDYLKKFVEEDPKNDNIQTHQDKLRNLEQRIAKTGFAVTSNVGDAAISIDGVEVGRTPHEGVIPAGVGAHVIKVTKPGYQDFVMNAAISWGYSVPIDAQLQPGTSPAVAAASLTTITTTDENGVPVDGPKRSPGKFRKALPWIVAGTGAAVAIFGWGVVGSQAYSTINDNNSTEAERNDAKDQAKAADGLGVIGAAGAVAGTIWGIIEYSRRKKNAATLEEARVRFTPVVSNETVAFSATLRF